MCTHGSFDKGDFLALIVLATRPEGLRDNTTLEKTDRFNLALDLTLSVAIT
jgi:hypothetical protein